MKEGRRIEERETSTLAADDASDQVASSPSSLHLLSLLSCRGRILEDQ